MNNINSTISLKKDIGKEETVVNFVNFGPYAFILPAESKTLFTCERRFFWAKDQAPEIVTTGKRDEWGPNKVLIHYRDERARLVPFREDSLNISWKKSITYSSQASLFSVESSGQIIVDCRE